MSLDNPTKFDKFADWWKGFRFKKVLLYCVLGLLLLLGVLYASARVSNWWAMRKIDQLKANVNAATQELKQSQTNINAGKQDEVNKMLAVNQAVREYANATNATDTAKAETNRALQNMANAVNANHPVGITAEQLERQLQGLDQ